MESPKKFSYFLPAIILLILSLPHLVHATEQPAGSPVQNLLKSADVGSDDNFKTYLGKLTHREDLTAPANLRDFLASFPIFRSDFGVAYEKTPDSTKMIWWINELAIKGSALDTIKALKSKMRKLGFKTQKSPDEDTYMFALDTKGIHYEVSIRQPENFTGSKFPACGTSIKWQVSIKDKSDYQTLSQITKELPILIDSRIDREIYESLATQKIANLSVGGTWTMYYTWQAELIPAEGQDLLQNLRDLAKARSFGTYTKEKDHEEFCRESTISYFFIYPSTTGKNITLRIQPQS
ncbi:MAG: hypothetical protein LWY06_13890 [Firmicutes bacterium]|nr:hypothetical protein [Bacillota bacterium]